MKAPAFWWDRPAGPAARLLQPFGALYGALTLRRMRRSGFRAALPVICIGNFTAGGAGKTPTALAMAAALAARGERPVFLTRGYGGTLSGPVVVDPQIHDSREVGDEALLLARRFATVVAADRAAGAQLAATLDGTVIIMDDGMQNPALAKDFTLAVIDGGVGLGNGLCLPAGPLRAPAAGQTRQIDAMLTIGAGPGIADALALGAEAGKPCHRTALTVDAVAAERLAGARVLAFAGIGRPQKFFETLGALYARIEAAQTFADHHVFIDDEATALLNAAEARKLLLVTTEKDWVRLKGTPALERLAGASFALPVRLDLPDELVDAAIDAIRHAQPRDKTSSS